MGLENTFPSLYFDEFSSEMSKYLFNRLQGSKESETHLNWLDQQINMIVQRILVCVQKSIRDGREKSVEITACQVSNISTTPSGQKLLQRILCNKYQFQISFIKSKEKTKTVDLLNPNRQEIYKHNAQVEWKSRLIANIMTSAKWRTTKLEELLPDTRMIERKVLWNHALEGNEIDVTFKFGDQKLYAHQHILRESDYYRALFNFENYRAQFAMDGGEKKTWEIKCEEKIEVFKYLLEFLYVNDILDLNQIEDLEELTHLADKYQLSNLEQWCVRHLNNDTFIQNNFVFIFNHSLTNNDEDLLVRCIDYAEYFPDKRDQLMKKISMENMQQIRDIAEKGRCRLVQNRLTDWVSQQGLVFYGHSDQSEMD